MKRGLTMLCVGGILSAAVPVFGQSQVPVFDQGPPLPKTGFIPETGGSSSSGSGSYGSRGYGQGLDIDIQTYSAGTNRPPSLPPVLLKQFMAASGQCEKAAKDKLKAGDNLGAAKLYQSLGVYRERVLGRCDLGASEAFFKACVLFERVKHYQEAESSIRESLAICNLVRGSGEPQAIPLLAKLGAVLNEENKPREAKSYLEQALTLEERKSGSSSKKTVQATINLADTYYKLDDFNSAEPLYERSLEVARKGNLLDVDHLTNLMNSYSAVLRHNDKLDQATQVLLDIKALRSNNMQKAEGQPAPAGAGEPAKNEQIKASDAAKNEQVKSSESAKNEQTKPVASGSASEKQKSEVEAAPPKKPVASASDPEKPKSELKGARETAQK